MWLSKYVNKCEHMKVSPRNETPQDAHGSSATEVNDKAIRKKKKKKKKKNLTYFQIFARIPQRLYENKILVNLT